ncbi:hypothetical protein J7J56_04410 [candidate division WOR-3 bacterium]|nr:hypothetical protein [candidate division WOR-3 bacterium]
MGKVNVRVGGSFVGGGLILALGVIALLRYFGVVHAIWPVFWPVALIIIGIGTIIGRFTKV